jgi:hypothetical protein
LIPERKKEKVNKFTIKSKHTYPLLEATIRDDDV